MRHFCTYFDSAYVWKGLAMYSSLQRVSNDFCLHVMALDDRSFAFLNQLTSPSLQVDFLGDIETEELLQIKSQRTRAEYCWTCGPTIIHHFITKFNLTDITYLDADLMFFSSFEPVYKEIGNASVAITPQYSDNDLSGRYCVQFMFFRNDTDGMACLQWWKDQCIKWCFARYEDGKFGDQKYLESFPILFDNVVETSQRGVGVAPWNMHLYQYSEGNVFFEGHSYPIVFYHFHGIKMETEGTTLVFKLTDCDCNDTCRRIFFLPYMKLIADTLHKYFDQEITDFQLEKQSHTVRAFKWIKSRLRHVRFLQRIYFSLYKHRGWENTKL